MSLTKKITSDEQKKAIKILQGEVRILMEFYNSSAQMIKDGANEASILRRSVSGFSCAACDKDINGLYNLINQTQEYSNWNKFPQRDIAKYGKVNI